MLSGADFFAEARRPCAPAPPQSPATPVGGTFAAADVDGAESTAPETVDSDANFLAEQQHAIQNALGNSNVHIEWSNPEGDKDAVEQPETVEASAEPSSPDDQHDVPAVKELPMSGLATGTSLSDVFSLLNDAKNLVSKIRAFEATKDESTPSGWSGRSSEYMHVLIACWSVLING